MSNTNSAAGYAIAGALRNQFPLQTVATVTETVLVVNTDTGTTPAFIVAPSGGQILGATQGLDINANGAITDRSPYVYGLPSGESNDQFSTASWDARAMRVRISGVGTAGANAAQSLIFNLYQGTSATVGSDHLIGTTGAAFAAVAGGAFNFYIEAKVFWDATSLIMSGSYEADIAFAATSQFTARAAANKFVFAGVTAPSLSFLASVVLGNAASSSLTVHEFVIDRI